MFRYDISDRHSQEFFPGIAGDFFSGFITIYGFPVQFIEKDRHGGKLEKGLKSFLALPCCLLGKLAVGEVGDHPKRADKVMGIIEHWYGGNPRPNFMAIPMAQPALISFFGALTSPGKGFFLGLDFLLE